MPVLASSCVSATYSVIEDHFSLGLPDSLTESFRVDCAQVLREWFLVWFGLGFAQLWGKKWGPVSAWELGPLGEADSDYSGSLTAL